MRQRAVVKGSLTLQAQAPFGPPPRWSNPTPMSREELEKLRTEFWGTYGSGAYGGQPGARSFARLACLLEPLAGARALTAACAATCAEIWDALKAACGADIDTARLICDAACVLVPGADLRTAYDERGALYELPLYVLSAPTNLV